VTSGVGVFGPFMRVGTDAEICDITVLFGEDAR
jgi:predicted MPP superfamily phosphohydrolase